MVLEVARIDVKPDMEEEFRAGVAKAVALFRAAEGCHGLTLRKSVETPSRYWLLIEWETPEHHMVAWRQSESFHEWRRLVRHCFEGPPAMEHAEVVLEGF